METAFYQSSPEKSSPENLLFPLNFYSQIQMHHSQVNWLQDQNLIMTSEELEAFETYTQMIRDKLIILREIYET